VVERGLWTRDDGQRIFKGECNEELQEATVDFVADNPGLTLFHCHQQLHMDFGFMTLFDYV
jgi:FtsP/CotA-like multicopper oxidase with cupredoxin domain